MCIASGGNQIQSNTVVVKKISTNDVRNSDYADILFLLMYFKPWVIDKDHMLQDQVNNADSLKLGCCPCLNMS